MYIKTMSGKLVFLDDIENCSLSDEQDNYATTSKDFYSKDRVKRQKLEKVYAFSSLKKFLKENYNYQLINITGYKGNRYSGLNTYRILDEKGNKVIDGHLHQIADWTRYNQGV